VLTVLAGLSASPAQAVWPFPVDGENVCYGASNRSRRELEQVRVVRASGPNRDLFAQAGQPPISEENRKRIWGDKTGDNLPYPKAHRLRSMGPGGGYCNRADTGKRVPDKALVQWREMPPPGGAPYTGELKGPYEVEVRSRIPAHVLKLAEQQEYTLRISFSAGETPVWFDWGLYKRGCKDHDKSCDSPVEIGGDLGD
jgi:hypothetical protein